MAYLNLSNLDREQWLALRRQGLGGTDAAAVLGLSPYRTAVDVYLEKTGQREPVADTPRMRAGRLLEDVVARWWALEKGFRVRRDNKMRFHPQYPELFANIDRLITTPGEKLGTGVLEVKTTSGYHFKRWENDGLPPDTYCQVMHYLMVTGHRWARVAVLVDGYDLKDIPVVYDREYIDLMRGQLLDFWHDHVLQGIPPEPRNESDVRSLWPRAQGDKIVQAGEPDIRTVDRLVDVTRQLAGLTEEKNDLEEQLKLTLRDATVLACGDEALVTWRQSKDAQRFDTGRFKTDFPALYQTYSDTRPGSRRFVLKKD